MYEQASKNASKLIKSLQQKKYRDVHGLFVVEGVKLVGEALSANADIAYLVFTGPPEDFPYSLPENSLAATERDLASISSLSTPNRIMAVCRKPEVASGIMGQGPLFALDGVADPGNMGTIIRLCDWFGMQHLVCDHHCVDQYNPKVVQATMGSIFRVSVHYVDLPTWLQSLPQNRQVYATHMEGRALYETQFGESPVIVLGSEAHGLRPEVARLATQKVGIPRIGGGESLNVAVSAAIFASAIAGKASK